MTWRDPTPRETQALAVCEAIVYHHDGLHEVVYLDNLPKELATYVRQQERDEARKLEREAARVLKRSRR